MDEIIITVNTEDGVQISVSDWENGGVWFNVRVPNARMSANMTRNEAEQLVAALQAVLMPEVAP